MGRDNKETQSRINEEREVQGRDSKERKTRGQMRDGEAVRDKACKEKENCSGKLAAVCRITGMLLILAVILLCSALVLPGIFGWHMYHVISGSMEPALKVGSLIYIHEDLPEDVQEGDIIAFYSASVEVRPPQEQELESDSRDSYPDDNSIVTHRVVKNNVVSGNFRTKGDANGGEDPMPVDYDLYIGRVKLSVPYMGAILTIMTSLEGKILAVCVVAAGVLLNLAGSRGDYASRHAGRS